MTSQEIITKILRFVKENGGDQEGWYVGITSDPKKRLFEDHQVDEENDVWISEAAESSDDAREIESYLLYNYGFDGSGGGGDDDSTYVYAYKESSRTEP